MTMTLAHALNRASAAGELVTALVELTHRCHLACVHCYLDDKNDQEKRSDELSTLEAQALISELRAAGCLFLTLTGGEIFLRPDVLDLAHHARDLGMAITLFTTGTLIGERRAREIAALRPWRVELSLYSTNPAVHDAITERPGSHAATTRALARLQRLGVPLAIKCPLMQANFDSYDDLKAYAAGRGMPFRADVTVTPTNSGHLGPTATRPRLDQLAFFYGRPEIRRFAAVQRKRPAPDERLCAIGTRSCVISPTGDVFACLGYAKPLGNVRKQPLLEIWRDSPAARYLRTLRAAHLDACASCEKFSYCNRCAGMALCEHGDFLGPSAWACQLARAKEKAAGLPSSPSAAERLGLVAAP